VVQPPTHRRFDWTRDRYGLLFVLLIVSYVLTGFNDSTVIRFIFGLVLVGVFILAAFAEGMPLLVRRTVAVVSGLFVVANIALVIGGSSETGEGLLSAIASAAQFSAVVLILYRISHHTTVSFQTVMGGIAAYALLGFAHGSLYEAIDFLGGQDFFAEPASVGDFLYFSLVTLTTVGYGDFVPATELGKRLVTVEALVGQVFLVTLVARLVALWGQPLPRQRRPDSGSA
jgi:voltage-gated potassium channel Kch